MTPIARQYFNAASGMDYFMYKKPFEQTIRFETLEIINNY